MFGRVLRSIAVPMGLLLLVTAGRTFGQSLPMPEAQFRDVPFQAVQVITRRPTAGASVVTRGRVARNEEGSTYLEVMNEQTGVPQEILIFDVPRKQEIILDVAQREYRVRSVPKLAARAVPLDWMASQLRAAEAQKDTSTREIRDGEEIILTHLGTKRLAGLEAVGSMDVRRPSEAPQLSRVQESWMSVELGLPVLMRQKDPSRGEDIEMTLTEILRSSPDPKLFVVPDGYKLESEDAKPKRRVVSSAPSDGL